VSASAVFERDVPLFVESTTGRIDKYPRNRWVRWGLRLAIAAGFATVAVWFDLASGGDWSGTANAALADRVASIDWGSGSVGVIGQLYPPISSLIALVVPGGALGLAIVGSLVAGLMIQLVLQSMQRKHFPVAVRALFTLTIALSPAFAYIATTNFEAALGLMFFGLGMIDLVRFVTWANTQAGFRAGILFACSAFSDTTGLFAALVAAAAGALIIQSRQKARFANAVVIVFPTLALLGALAVLGWAFGAGPLSAIRGDLSWDGQRAEWYVQSVFSPAGLLYLAPTLLIVATGIALGHTGVGLVGLLITAMTGLAYILGLTPPGVAGNTFVMLLLFAVAVVPTAATLRHAVLISSTSILLFASGLVYMTQLPAITHWLSTLAGGAL
jgi:hypothetical protein